MAGPASMGCLRHWARPPPRLAASCGHPATDAWKSQCTQQRNTAASANHSCLVSSLPPTHPCHGACTTSHTCLTAAAPAGIAAHTPKPAWGAYEGPKRGWDAAADVQARWPAGGGGSRGGGGGLGTAHTLRFLALGSCGPTSASSSSTPSGGSVGPASGSSSSCGGAAGPSSLSDMISLMLGVETRVPSASSQRKLQSDGRSASSWTLYRLQDR